jgi:hypothetical protein
VVRPARSVYGVSSARGKCGVSHLDRWSVCGRSDRVDLCLGDLHRESLRRGSEGGRDLEYVWDLSRRS